MPCFFKYIKPSFISFFHWLEFANVMWMVDLTSGYYAIDL